MYTTARLKRPCRRLVTLGSPDNKKLAEFGARITEHSGRLVAPKHLTVKFKVSLPWRSARPSICHLISYASIGSEDMHPVVRKLILKEARGRHDIARHYPQQVNLMGENDSGTRVLRIPTCSRPIWYAVRSTGIQSGFSNRLPRSPVTPSCKDISLMVILLFLNPVRGSLWR